jgi:hypothetical protein
MLGNKYHVPLFPPFPSGGFGTMIPMRATEILVTAALGLLLARAGDAQSARDYFNELYKAGGLDRMADEYVCFDESPELQTFFIYTDSEVLKEFFIQNGAFAKLPKGQQADLNKGFLVVRQYDKGIALGDKTSYSKDGSSWVTEMFYANKTPMRMRLTVTPETLRYRRTVEILNANSELQSEVARYGRCERIPDSVRQKGN